MGRSYTSRNSNSKAVHTHHEATLTNPHVISYDCILRTYRHQAGYSYASVIRVTYDDIYTY